MASIDAPVPYDLSGFDGEFEPEFNSSESDQPQDQGDEAVRDERPQGYARPQTVTYEKKSILPGVNTPAAKLDSASGLVFGAIAYAVMINYMRGGPSRVKEWFLAKLINGRSVTQTDTGNANSGGNGLGPKAGTGKGQGGGGGGSW